MYTRLRAALPVSALLNKVGNGHFVVCGGKSGVSIRGNGTEDLVNLCHDFPMNFFGIPVERNAARFSREHFDGPVLPSRHLSIRIV
jgi:hypothetical protein